METVYIGKVSSGKNWWSASSTMTGATAAMEDLIKALGVRIDYEIVLVTSDRADHEMPMWREIEEHRRARL